MSFSRANTNKRAKRPEPLDEAALYDYAVKALGRRMRTVAELKRLMRTRVEQGEGGDAKISSVIDRLQQQRYLDDAAYAATYTRLRQENDKFGPRRVRQELSRKGVNSELIAESVEKGYQDVSEEALVRDHLARKQVRLPSNEKESARVVRLLLRAGFSTGTIFKILKEWRVDDEALAALEAIDSDENAGA